jgi:hypothetical protein
MDIYMYAFGEASHPMVLRHVSYGGVSEYMAVSPGRYSVAMRAAGAPASSPPCSGHELHGARADGLHRGWRGP